MDFVWLRHPGTGGTFRCPADAVEAWQANGWEPTGEPVEQNPATAEWQPLNPPAAVEPEAPKSKTKAAARGESKEG